MMHGQKLIPLAVDYLENSGVACVIDFPSLASETLVV